MEKNPEDKVMRRTQLAVVVVGAALALSGVIFFGKEMGMSIAVGAMLAAVNLKVLSTTVRRLVQGSNVSWAGVALLKFLVLMAVVYGLIESQFVQPLGLASGFLALPLGILLGAGLAPHDSEGDFDSRVESDHA